MIFVVSTVFLAVGASLTFGFTAPVVMLRRFHGLPRRRYASLTFGFTAADSLLPVVSVF